MRSGVVVGSLKAATGVYDIRFHARSVVSLDSNLVQETSLDPMPEDGVAMRSYMLENAQIIVLATNYKAAPDATHACMGLYTFAPESKIQRFQRLLAYDEDSQKTSGCDRLMFFPKGNPTDPQPGDQGEWKFSNTPRDGSRPVFVAAKNGLRGAMSAGAWGGTDDPDTP